MIAIGRAICIASRIILFFVLTLLATDVCAEDVFCDPTIDTSAYYCRGWQDGVGKFGSRVHFIARMLGEENGDDFGFEIVPLGDINGDQRGDFMLSVRNQCEWRIYLGDSLISKNPYLTWPSFPPPYPCGGLVGRFFSTPDISGDGQPDLFRSRASTLKQIDIYFAGSAFDTLPDLTISDSDFIFPGGAGNSMAAGLDLNGDGDPDFVLGDPSYVNESQNERGRVYAYWGGSALDSIPDLIFSDTIRVGQNQPTAVGGAIAVVPSINGDSYADLVLGRRSQNYLKDPLGRVDIVFGGPTMDTTRDLTFVGPDTGYSPSCDYIPATYFGGFTEDVGDVNQDGHRDLLISGYGCVPSYIYYGGPGFDTIVDLRLSQSWPTEQGEGSAMTVLGDVNGDGFRDFCTILEGDDVFGGWVNIHFSRPNPTGVVDWTIAGDQWFLTASDFGRATTSLGDVNGDGFDDFAVGMETSYVDENNRGQVYIFAGYNPDINSGVFDDPETPVPMSQRLIEHIAPNPFNAGTTIRLSGSFDSGTIVIYNILGRAVRSFELASHATYRDLFWDGRDERGVVLASGLYFARASDGARSETHKLVLLK